MGANRSRLWVATTVLVAIATVLLLGVMLSACGGDKLAGKWKQQDSTGMIEIKKAAGSGAEITLRPVSGGLEMKNGTQTITLVKQ